MLRFREMRLQHEGVGGSRKSHDQSVFILYFMFLVFSSGLVLLFLIFVRHKGNTTITAEYVARISSRLYTRP